jgi:PAS domain S-box-containing protein
MSTSEDTRPSASPDARGPATVDPRRFRRELARLVALPAALGTGCAAGALTLAWWHQPPGGDRALLASATLAVVAGAVAITIWAGRRAQHLAGRYLATHAHRERDARAAAESEARLAGIIGSAMDAIITIDHRDRIVVFNRMAELTFGWSADEMVGQPLDRLLPERFRGAHARHVGSYAETGASSRSMGRPGQLLALRKDGSEFPIEATISKVTVGNDRLLTVILRDVSERVRAEDDRQRQADRVARYAHRLEGVREIDRAVLASSQLDQLVVAALLRLAPLLAADEVSVSVVADNGDAMQHRVVPRAAPQASVHVRPAGTSQSVDEWIAAEGGMVAVDDLDRPPLGAEPALALRHDGRHRSYLGVSLRSGTAMLGRLDAWATGAAAFDADAREVALEVADQLAIAIEQAQLREDLRRHASHLEARVAERTRALQDVNAELNAFAYSVSHDLRAPLRSMQGFAQALLEDYGAHLDEAGRDYAQRIVAASRRMDDLIQDLLAYSRLSRAEVELQAVDLEQVTDSAAAIVADLAQPVAPEFEVVRPMPAVVGHAGVLSQVLQNLIGNAVKFVAPGTQPRVRISAEARDSRVWVSVQDNGIGIPPEYQERIFRVFERLHPLEAYPGTGIGLAIVRKGVERLGGRCGVESEEGRGSRFWLDLPAAPPRVVPASPEQ